MKPEDILKYADDMDRDRNHYYPAELVHTYQANDEFANDLFREYAGAVAYYKEHEGEGDNGPYLLEAMECALELWDHFGEDLKKCWPWADFFPVHVAACLLYMAEVGETD